MYLEKLQKLFSIIIFIFLFFQLFYLFNIMTYDYSKFKMIKYFFLNNWSNNLIKKIRIEYQDINNDKDYTWESLINITLPEIPSICDCTSFYEIIYKGECKLQFSENCIAISPVEKQYFNTLYCPEIDNFLNKGLKVIIERYNDINYFNLLNNTINNSDYFLDNSFKCSCPEYSEICFDCGIIDTIGNHLCITTYNGLKNNCYKLKLEYDFSLKDTQIIKDFEKIFNNNDNNNLQFPVEFINVFDKNICIFQEESIYTPLIFNKLNYIKKGELNNQGCNSKLFFNISYDNNWVNIFNFEMDYLFDKQIKKIFKSLPNFPYNEFIHNNLSISYRTYNGIRKHCINDIEFILKDIPSYNITVLIFILLFIYSSFFIPYYLEFYETGLERLNQIQILIIVISFIAIIYIMLQSLFMEYEFINKKYKSMNIIANKFCGDELTNNLLFSIFNDYKNINYYIRYSIYWTFAMLIGSVIKFILILMKFYKERIIYTLINGNNYYNLFTHAEIQFLN